MESTPAAGRGPGPSTVRRVLLVSPPGPFAYSSAHPHLGLGYLSTALKRAGHDVRVLDLDLETYRKSRPQGRALQLLLQQEFDAVGFTVMTPDFPFINKAVAALRDARRTAVAIVGGAGPSCLGARIFEYLPQVDYAFVGEAETGLPALLARLEQGAPCDDVPGLVWRADGGVRANPAAFIDDLDSLGPVDWPALQPQRYPIDYFGFPTIPVTVTRGCPFSCNYCGGALTGGRRMRSRSPAAVIDELAFLRRTFGVASFSVVDDNLTVNKAVAREFGEKLLASGLNFKWRFYAGLRVETLDLPLMQLYEKAGCYFANVAIESGSQRVLDLMNRKSNLERLTTILREVAAGTNIKLMGYFILGYPGETVAEARESIAFARSLPLHLASFFSFVPIPGTAAFRQLQDEGRLENYDIGRNSFYGRSESFTGYSTPTLHRLHRQAYLRFYLRPRVVYSLIRDLSSLAQFRRLAARAVSVLLRRG
jgi:radical SAM superfamily enzyme YgiQ (UPF0313 family)